MNDCSFNKMKFKYYKLFRHYKQEMLEIEKN